MYIAAADEDVLRSSQVEVAVVYLGGEDAAREVPQVRDSMHVRQRRGHSHGFVFFHITE
nr:MAG: hypothetical protein J07AB56_04070 [Candidatus Nanosalinarum sp. J07AB56]